MTLTVKETQTLSCKKVSNLPAIHGSLLSPVFDILHQYREYGSKCRKTKALSILISPRELHIQVHKGYLGCSYWRFAPASHYAHRNGVHPRLQDSPCCTISDSEYDLFGIGMTELHSTDRRRTSKCFSAFSRRRNKYTLVAY